MGRASSGSTRTGTPSETSSRSPWCLTSPDPIIGAHMSTPPDPPREAFEEDPKLSTAAGFMVFRNWVLRHKRPEADSLLLDGALDEAKVAGKDLKTSQALSKVEDAQSGGDNPWSTIAEYVDFNSMTMEREARQQATDAAEVVKGAIEAGIIKPKDVGLYRRDTDVDKLRSQLAEYRKREADAEERRRHSHEDDMRRRAGAQAPPRPPDRTMNFTEEEADLLMDYFTTAIRRGQKKEPTPAELMKIGDFIDRLQTTKFQGGIEFDRAKKQVEEYASGLNALSRGKGLPARRERTRVQDILDKMLTGP